MTDHRGRRTRTAENKDVPYLKALWKNIFGDSDADINYFFDTWFAPDMTAIIDGNEATPVSAAYILPVGELVLPQVYNNPDHNAARRYGCAMLYAIATLPEYRGCSYGEAVTRAALELAVKKGFPAVVLKPADDGLFEFYKKHTEFHEFFDAYMTEFTDAGLPPHDPRYTVLPVSPAEYRRLRNGFLEGGTFIDMDERGLSYQQYLSAKTGGGLHALLSDGTSAGCAVIEREGDTVQIKELLLARGCGMTGAVSAIAKLFPAENYAVRSLSGDDAVENGNFRRFGMMAPVQGRPNIPYVYSAKWYGPAFD